jgi:hypothetical protein
MFGEPAEGGIVFQLDGFTSAFSVSFWRVAL